MAEIYRSDIVRVDLDHALLRKHVGAILVTGDKLGNRFGAEIFRDGNPVDVTGCGVTAYFMRPGEDAIVLNGTASGSVAYVDLAQACYSKASSFTLTIKISYGGSTTALRVIDGYILLTQTDDLVDPGDVVPTLDDIFAQIAAMETVTERAQAATADAIAAKDNANGAAVYAVNIATEKGNQAIQLAQEEAGKQNVKIATLTEEIGEIRTHTRNIFEGKIEQGNISSSTGADDNNMANYYVRTQNYIPVDTSIVQADGHCYLTLSYDSAMNIAQYFFYDADKAFASAKSERSGDEVQGRKSTSVFVPSNAKYVRFSTYGSMGANKYTPDDVELIQLEYGKTMTDYANPYTAKDDVARENIEALGTIVGSVEADVENTTGYTSNIFRDNQMEQGNIDSTGNNSTSLPQYYVRCKTFVAVDSERQYALSFISPMNAVYVYFYDTERKYISASGKLSSWVEGREYTSRRTFTFETPSNCAFVRFAVFGSTGTTKYTPDEVTEVQVEKGSVATVYIPPHTAVDSVARNRITIPLQYACGRILCIGDSLTEGYYPNLDAIPGVVINESYPYYLGRMLNADVTNAGGSGGAPSTWLAAYPGYDFTPYDTVIIWLGTNGGLSADDIGVDGTETHAYNALIQTVKASNPTCKIILATVFATGELRTGVTPYSVAVTNSAIRALADTYGTDLVDMAGIGHLQHPELHSTSDTTHFTKGGNIYVAARFIKHMAETFNVGNVEFGLTVKR